MPASHDITGRRRPGTFCALLWQGLFLLISGDVLRADFQSPPISQDPQKSRILERRRQIQIDQDKKLNEIDRLYAAATDDAARRESSRHRFARTVLTWVKLGFFPFVAFVVIGWMVSSRWKAGSQSSEDRRARGRSSGMRRSARKRVPLDPRQAQQAAATLASTLSLLDSASHHHRRHSHGTRHRSDPDETSPDKT